VSDAAQRHVDDVDDKELMRQHLDGDAGAFGELVRRHRDRFWAVALHTVGDREEAADALQDALLSAFRRADSYRGEAAVTTWLHRIVVNACLDRVRRRKARPADPLGDDQERLPTSEAATEVDPADEREERIDVMAALARLNADQRAAVVLVDMEGYSMEEAATLLDCPVGTVKSRCARGRARLLPMLAHLRQTAGISPSPTGGNRNADPSVASSMGHDDPGGAPGGEGEVGRGV